MRAIDKAQRIQERASQILDTIKNYKTVAQRAEQMSEMSIQDATQLTVFYQLRVEFALNVSKSLHSSYNSSDSLVGLAEKLEEHARQDKEVSCLILSPMIYTFPHSL